jgi:hypothetical protein
MKNPSVLESARERLRALIGQETLTNENNQTEDGERKDALAADRRGPNKERGVPVPSDLTNVKRNWPRRPDPDQDHHDQHDHHGHDRVHRDAQCAVISIVIRRVEVRHLDNGKQRYQDQAHNRRHPQSVWL